MGTTLGAPEGPPVTTAPLGLVTQEVNRIYQSGLLEAEDLWQWEALPSPSTRTKSVTLEGVDEAGSGGWWSSCRGHRSRGRWWTTTCEWW